MSIAKCARNVPFVLERLCDVDEAVRRAAFLYISAVNVTQLRVRQRLLTLKVCMYTSVCRYQKKPYIFNIPHDVSLLFVTYTLCVVIIGGFNGAQSARASRCRRNPHPWLAEHIPREYCWSAQSNTIGQREWCQGLAVCGWETTGVAFQVRYSTCLLFGYKYLNCLVHQI